MNLFYQPALIQGVYHLDPDESRHAVKVMRMQAGDRLYITDGQGTFYNARITKSDASVCEFEITEIKKVPRRPFEITIAIAPTKNIDRTEWFVEKAIEIGIEKIIFMECRNSERHHINHDRIRKIAISALKQSAQAWLPEISELKSFKEILSITATQKFICYVNHDNPKMMSDAVHKHASYITLIGPEGDFAESEVKDAIANGFELVSLGPNRLRTETAALTACQLLNFINL